MPHPADPRTPRAARSVCRKPDARPRAARIARATVPVAALFVLWTATPWTAARAQRVVATVDLPTVRVEVTWVESQRQMDSLRREFGRTRLARSSRETRLHGFAVLGKRDGEYVCLLFVQRPQRVNDDATLTLGHEMLHCLLGDYHAE